MLCNPYGQCKSGIVLLKSMPSPTDHSLGRIFGSDFDKFAFIDNFCNAKTFLDLDFEEDCYITSILKERTKSGNFPRKKPKEEMLITEKEILQKNPVLIIAFGKDAIKFALPDCPANRMSDFKMHGRAIYSSKFDCLVGCTLTEALSRTFVIEVFRDLDSISDIFAKDNYRLSDFDFDTGNIIIDNSRKNPLLDFEDLVTKFIKEGKPISFDYESSGTDPNDPNAMLYSVSFSNDPNIGYGIPLEFKNHWKAIELAFIMLQLRRLLESNVPKVIQNSEFEVFWSSVIGCSRVNNIIYDTMIGYHVIDDRQGICGLDFQVFEISGRSHKGMVNVKKLINEPLENLLKYNIIDSRITLKLYEIRQKYIKENPWAAKPTDFFMRALPLLGKLKCGGIKIDTVELDRQHKFATSKIKELSTRIKELDAVKLFKTTYNKDILLTSSKDLKLLCFELLKIIPIKFTVKNNPCLDAETLEKLSKKKSLSKSAREFFNILMELRQYKKIVSTYLEPYKELTKNVDYIHPTCALHTTRTYRSSYMNPNLQNIPVRSEKGKELRKLFIPRYDLFLDIDISGAEVRVAAMYSKDDAMRREILAGVDIHTKWAAKIYEKNESEITKDERALVKSNFIFLFLYGGSISSSAYALNMKKPHIKKLYTEFWKAYPGLKKWQNHVKELYDSTNYVELATGFRRQGPLNVLAQINTPIQGMSFHFLLNALVNINRICEERNLVSRIVLQVHDEILIDAVEEECEEIIDIVEAVFNTDYFPDFCNGINMQIDWSYGKNFGELQKL